MEILYEAIENAGEELIKNHGWRLGYHNYPILKTTFAKVLIKHLEPIMGKEHLKAFRKARIDALEAEIEKLEAIDEDEDQD